MMNCLNNQRDRFSIQDDIAYFNCAYMSPLAKDVLNAMTSGAALKAQPWEYSPGDFFRYSEQARDRFAKLARCDSNAIALVPSASYGLAIAARNVAVARHARILVLAEQFPSNVYVWRERAQQAGASIKTVHKDPGSGWTDAVLTGIADDVAVVAIPHCHWSDGELIDLAAVSDACRRVGAALVIDATQSLGVMPIDLESVQPDFLVAAAYKWLMSPYGTGMLYAAPKHHEGMPLEHNWINRAGSEDFSQLVNYNDSFQPGARRFDMGEKANPPLLMGVVAAIDMLMGWGVENIATTIGQITDEIDLRASALGYDTSPSELRSPHILSLRFAGAPPSGAADTLAARGVHVSMRGPSLRIAPHVYNTDADVEQLIAALGAL